MSASTPEPTAAAAEFARAAEAAAQAAETALAAGRSAEIPDAALQQVLTAAIRLFATKCEQERRYFLPLTAQHAVTATEAAVLVTELLRAVDLNLFDLSMWASRPRD